LLPLMFLRLARSPPSPYTTLFRSLEALRECARRHTPAISDRPADVYVPDDADITSPAPESSPGSTGYSRPPGAGLVSTTATRHRSEEHTSELQSRENLVCRLLLEK